MLDKMLKMRNKKGFTLMEMLIVVAIIAILIAIAIPTFNSSLNKARVATDEANIRSGYAAVQTEILAGDEAIPDEGKTFTLNADGSITAGGTAYVCGGKPAAAVSIGGTTAVTWDKGNTITYVVAVNNGATTVTITPVASK